MRYLFLIVIIMLGTESFKLLAGLEETITDNKNITVINDKEIEEAKNELKKYFTYLEIVDNVDYYLLKATITNPGAFHTGCEMASDELLGKGSHDLKQTEATKHVKGLTVSRLSEDNQCLGHYTKPFDDKDFVEINTPPCLYNGNMLFDYSQRTISVSDPSEKDVNDFYEQSVKKSLDKKYPGLSNDILKWIAVVSKKIRVNEKFTL